MRRRGSCLVMTMIAMTLGVVSAAGSAGAAQTFTINIRGVVACAGQPVQGIYVSSTRGGSGFATWQSLTSATVATYFFTINATQAGTDVQLRVGCGGTRATWGTTAMAPVVTVHRTAPMGSLGWEYPTFLNVDCSGNQCTYPALPRAWSARPGATSPNPGQKGQCTDGASSRWRDLLDVYPSWGGDAGQWGAMAAQQGYTTKTDAPRLGSIVSKRDGGAGHVFMVTSLTVSGSRVMMWVYDMNGDGRGVGTERWNYPYGYWDASTMTSIVPPYVPEGDTNNDRRIDDYDLSYLLSHDGTSDWRADFNDDGTVGSADLAMLLAWSQ